MKCCIQFVVFIAVLSAAVNAEVRLKVYEQDGQTPFDGRTIMVGTQLKLMVTSDAREKWSGGLFISEENRGLGLLSGSGKDPNSRDYADCHLTDAGPCAFVTWWEDSVIEGFDMFTDSNGLPGTWFQVDYTALAPGDPNVGLYEHSVSWHEPNAFVTFHQVPSADFNSDGIVNLSDYSFLAYYWLEEDCVDPNGCKKADLYSDGVINTGDLLLFADYWLWGAPDAPAPATFPFDDPVPDPNLVYRIVDVNGLSEITIEVGETITLYVDMVTYNANKLWFFNVEINISDPNLGEIDNRPYDPNNPPGPGTARILAQPDRWAIFDLWGPGYEQEEGIYFSGVSFGSAFTDGYLASFEYTAQSVGDVILNLINWESLGTGSGILYPTLKSIRIHQYDPMEQMMMGGDGMGISPMSTMEASTSTMSTDEAVEFFEEIWMEESNLQETIGEEVWDEFIEAVEASN